MSGSPDGKLFNLIKSKYKYMIVIKVQKHKFAYIKALTKIAISQRLAENGITKQLIINVYV